MGGYAVSREGRLEYLRKIHPRYATAGRGEKGRILDEFCEVTGYNRKYALRLLNAELPRPREGPPRRRRARYGPQALSALAAIWEAAGYPWSIRLKALLPTWLPWARRRFRLEPWVEKQILRISARQIDRRLQGRKRKIRRRLYGRTKPGTLLKHQIPLRSERWEVHEPGYSEVDLVAHSGDSGEGEFIHSLNVTDILTTWVETRAVMGKAQGRVREALEEIRHSLPFRLCGIDSDNGSEFINAHLYRYCRLQGIQFTRGRPYKKDDNAHIEQKNWTHVRKLMGYLRYDTQGALDAMNRLYRNELRLLQNLFLPSVKLLSKRRVGSRQQRRYDAPQTPFERVVDSGKADPRAIAELKSLRERLDPFELSRSVDRQLERIHALGSRHVRTKPTPRLAPNIQLTPLWKQVRNERARLHS